MSPLLSSMMSRFASTSRDDRPLYASMPPEMSCRFMPCDRRFTCRLMPLRGLHLQLDPRFREVRALADLQPVHVQVGGAAGQVLDVMPRTAIFLTSFWL